MLSAMQGVKTENISGDSWFTPARFAGLLALLVMASYPQIFLGIQTFVYRDFGYFSYPIAYHFRESFLRGEIPLWNSLSDCGTPFLAQWNTQVLYPPALFYLLLPLSWSLGVFCLLHLFWGGLGMFFLAQRWTKNGLAAAFAGIVFAFNGLMINSLAWPATIAALSWMPWVVRFMERAWREGGNKIIVAAIGGTLQMLSGGTEVILLTWIFLGALVLLEFFREKSSKRKILFRAGLVVLLVSGLSAAQLLPFFDLLNYSRKMEIIDSSQSPMPLTGWLNFLAPLFHCHAYQGVFMQTGQNWISSYYVGVSTIALAFWAMLRPLASTRLMAALVLICLVLALGDATPIYNWLNHCAPVVGLIRFPIKFVILPVFLLPLLATFAFSEIRAKNIWSIKQWLWIWLITTTAIIAILLWNHFASQMDEDRQATFFNGLARLIFFTVIICGMILLEKISKYELRRLFQILLLFVIWLDLYHHAPQPKTVSPEIYKPNQFRPFALNFGEGRAMIPPDVRNRFNVSFLPDLTQEYISRRIALAMNCNLLDDIPKCDGFFPLYLADHVALNNSSLPDSLLDFLGVSEILMAEPNTFYWKQRSTFMPLLTAGQKPLFADDQTTLRFLANTNFNPLRQIYLPLAAKEKITATTASAVKISSAKFANQKIEADVQADTPAMLSIAQTYYHPWRAYVDGRPTQLWRANFAFQALEIPPGAHHVKLIYQDRRFYFGAIISLLTLAVCPIFYRLGILKYNKHP